MKYEIIEKIKLIVGKKNETINIIYSLYSIYLTRATLPILHVYIYIGHELLVVYIIIIMFSFYIVYKIHVNYTINIKLDRHYTSNWDRLM